MTTHFYTASSLDGFIATRDHSLEWLLALDFDQHGPMAYPEFIKRIGALAMGVSTYEWLLAHDEGWGYQQPTWVFSHHEHSIPDEANVRFIQGSPTEAMASIEASAGGRDVWVVGGGGLAGQFAQAGLLDEIWVQFAPLTLGSGQPLFTHAVDLELIDLAENSGFVCTHYRVRK